MKNLSKSMSWVRGQVSEVRVRDDESMISDLKLEIHKP
jgi:hypothetical protein